MCMYIVNVAPTQPCCEVLDFFETAVASVTYEILQRSGPAQVQNFKQAFDKIDTYYISQIFKKCGFGEIFINR